MDNQIFSVEITALAGVDAVSGKGAPEPVLERQLRVDVFVTNLPAHFLGAAFDLVIDGEQWQFERAELGPIFNVPEHTFVLTTKRELPQRLVFGMSLERGFILPSSLSSKNRLVSFYLTTGNQVTTGDQGQLRASFQHGVLSIFDGQRRNLAGVQWRGAQVNLSNQQQQPWSFHWPRLVQQLRPPFRPSQPSQFGPSFSAQTEQFSGQSQALTNNVFGADRSANALVDVYWLLSAILLFSFVVFLLFLLLYRFGRKPN